MSALNGFRILELAEDVAGEYCGKLLADFGAEVVKIEKPGGGSPTRYLSPLARSGTEGERSGLFAYLNTNKSSVTLDITTEAGAETLAKLLDHVDAVIDDHPPGWLEGAGLDPATIEQRRPGLVLCAITAFGQSPLEDRLNAEDLNVFHASGWGFHTPGATDGSKPPLNGPGRFQPSYESGLDAALCVAAALYDLDISKKGQFIDISKQAVLASRIDYVLGQMVAGDMDVSNDRGAYDLYGPAGIFPCRDGYVYIWMSTPAHWEALRTLLGDPAWMKPFPEGWLERGCTPERVEECRKHLAVWLRNEDKESVSAEGQKLGLTLAPLSTIPDLIASPQFAFREFFAEITHPVLGRVLYPTVPYKLSETPAHIHAPAPLLGQHTEILLDALRDASSANGNERARTLREAQ